MTAVLEMRDVSLSFAGLKALKSVSLSVETGRLAAVIGPNGAGKTSLFNCISGIYRPDSGEVRLNGEPITTLTPHEIAGRGVARMFQNLALFENLTTLQNLLVGCHHRFRSRWWQDLFWLPATRREEQRMRGHVEEVIDFLDLARYRDYPVGVLPYGVRKRIELGRALCMDAKLLLLDEPAAGLNQEETEDLALYILDIRDELGISQLIIEHELGLVMDLADHISVLDFGEKIAEGSAEDIRNDERVMEAYIGTQEAGAAA